MSEPNEAFEQIADLIADADHGWSIGSFGAIGEFMRDPDEPVEIRRTPGRIEMVTDRGAMRVKGETRLRPIAWDSLSADGESWGHALAFCVPVTANGARTIADLGLDEDALRPQDRSARIFDLGVGSGVIRMGLRTTDAALITVMEACAGQAMLDHPALMGAVLRAQPHRVLLSPAGRIEVFQPIPPPDGKSPEGPHTHLLPKLIVKDRAHSANVPIPLGWQSALTMHPASPWRTSLGERTDFNAARDAAFAPLLGRYGLAADHETEREIHAAIDDGMPPEAAAWPTDRRGRTKARIELRRRAAIGDARVKSWRALFDRGAPEEEPQDPEHG